MTVSFRVAGKVVHVSNTPPRMGGADIAGGNMLSRIRLDPVAIHSLRQMLAAELGNVVLHLPDPSVVAEAGKRLAAGRWSLVVVDSPRMSALGLSGDPHSAGGAGGAAGAAGAGGAGAAGAGGKNAQDPEKSLKKTWIEIELLDKNRRPLRGVKAEITLPDGSVTPGTLNDKGSMRVDNIDPGTCIVRFPEIDGREWAKSSAFCDGTCVDLFKGAPKIPAGPYTVKQGDHISSICAEAGFVSWKTVWDDGKNAAIKNERNPNVLYPGDIIEIPAKQKKEESVPAGDYHTFQTIGDPVQLRIVVLDWAGNPIVDTDLEFQLDGSEKSKTAGDGSAKKNVDPTGNKEGKLVVKGYELGLKLGHLDPVEKFSGQVWRLNNLGYRASDAAAATDMVFKSAVEEFQCDYGLTVDGVCGPNTQSKLKDIHGS